MVTAAAGNDTVDFAFIGIERRDNGQPRVAVSEIRENGASEVSDSHQRNGTVFRAVEYDGDAGDEAGDIISFMRAALVPDRHNVAPHLSRSVVSQCGELV